MWSCCTNSQISHFKYSEEITEDKNERIFCYSQRMVVLHDVQKLDLK